MMSQLQEKRQTTVLNKFSIKNCFTLYSNLRILNFQILQCIEPLFVQITHSKINIFNILGTYE